ncbi:hypothetical protein CEUSTIGMA_g9168.t1 [Chlamydomonas eustigma]|uniref:Uncharacterized protein n=1 Tax=Chlamydomonas eustigma TaxID=1157962 RepID=A0A250XG25_9CHLO|nr:hypothetical protein CEUSTIGMA_g9168.t1 [Chlamydomonas eustigma]|eukprot:GAX81740.1 hypothetical protein CEUSTIGMA_g9168.t1 [Chlamydomonas eustigma]
MPLLTLQVDWSGKPLYSMWVSRELGLVRPWEQYGLYMSTGGACTAAYKYFAKARAVFQAAKSTTDVAVREELMALHWLSPAHLSNARVWAARFRIKGISFLSVPVLWVAWRSMDAMLQQKYS